MTPYRFRTRPEHRRWSKSEAEWTRREAGNVLAAVDPDRPAPNRRFRRSAQQDFRRKLDLEARKKRRQFIHQHGPNTVASEKLPRPERSVYWQRIRFERATRLQEAA